MATYILLLTLDQEGREKMVSDAHSPVNAASACQGDNVRWLGLYGVLGHCDFVSIVEAPDNQSIARFSLELGYRAGAHIETLPAVPIGLLEGETRQAPRPGGFSIPEPV